MKKNNVLYFLNLILILLLGACTGTKTEPTPKPTVDFSFSPTNPSTDDEITFTAIGSNTKTYQWLSSPVGISSTQSSFKTKLSTAGTYQVTVTAKGDGGETSLTKSIIVTAPVLNPLGDFTFSPANPTVGESVKFTATVQNAISFEWTSVPAGFTSTQQSPNFVFNTAGNYQITLKATGAAGSTPITVSKQLTVNAAKPTLDFSFAPANPIVGQNVTFTATAQNVTSFSWISVPAGLSSTQQNPSFAFTTAGNYQVTLTATGAGGNTSVTKTVNVAANNLTANFTFSPTSPKAGEAITFTYAGTGATSFVWSSNPVGLNATSQNATHSFSSAGAYVVTLTVKDAFNNSQVSTQNVTVAASGSGSGSLCQDENKCNLPKCYPTRLTATTTGGTINSVFEYTTIGGTKFVSKLTVTTAASGLTITNTSLYDYDSQARNTKITTTIQTPFATTTVVTENIYDVCKKTRTNSYSNNVLTGYTTYEYDGAGRMTKSTSFDASNKKTGQNVYSNFNAEGYAQNEEQSDANGTVTVRVTTSYQNCQVSKLIGKDAAGNTITDLTTEFNAQRMTSKNTIISTSGGITVNTVTNYEYMCE